MGKEAKKTKANLELSFRVNVGDLGEERSRETVVRLDDVAVLQGDTFGVLRGEHLSQCPLSNLGCEIGQVEWFASKVQEQILFFKKKDKMAEDKKENPKIITRSLVNQKSNGRRTRKKNGKEKGEREH